MPQTAPESSSFLNMAEPTSHSAGIDQIEREKSIQKDAELQLEDAGEPKTLSVSGEAVDITPKTWWVIFVRASGTTWWKYC